MVGWFPTDGGGVGGEDGLALSGPTNFVRVGSWGREAFLESANFPGGGARRVRLPTADDF